MKARVIKDLHYLQKFCHIALGFNLRLHMQISEIFLNITCSVNL